MVIGRLRESDQDAIDEQMDILYETSVDPFANEPVRHKALRVHSEQSVRKLFACRKYIVSQKHFLINLSYEQMNAETP